MFYVLLNNQWVPNYQATVSVMDRGFLFGDGVYEVIPVYNRLPFELDAHLNRLQNSLNGILLENPHSLTQWSEKTQFVIDNSGLADAYIYLHVSRGASPKRDHAFPKEINPTVLIYASSLPVMSLEQKKQGLKTLSSVDTRWLHCDWKTTALLGNVLFKQKAVSQGLDECILFRDGFLTEGSSTNIFVVSHDDELLIVPKSNLILAGITYDVVIRLAQHHFNKGSGLKPVIRMIAEQEVRDAKEIWLTSSIKEIMPITELDGRKVGVNYSYEKSWAYQMHLWFQEYKNELH